MGQERAINLYIQKADDILFKSPIHFRNKRLVNQDVEEFLVEEAEGMPGKNDIILLIYAEKTDPRTEDAVIKAIHQHFDFSSRKVDMKLKFILKLGWRNLLISFMFLVIMFFIALAITTFLPENTLMVTFRELFIILGWVALWRPADLLLYEWRSYKRKRELLSRLAQCKVNILSSA